MKNLRLTVCIAFTFLVTAFASPMLSRAGIVIDYTGDTFFASNPVAMAALEAAAADINAAVDFSCLNAITDDTITGTNGASSASFTFSKTYLNPADGNLTTVPNTHLAVGQVNIFAGARTFAGNILGDGSAGGTGIQPVALDANDGTFALALANAEANEQHSRGGGPVINAFSGAIGSNVVSFDQGLHTGSVAFNDSANWHFDHTTAVAAGLNDFYSVAIHELLHTIGFGISDSWGSLVSGTNYLGAEGIAANGGSGVGLVAADGDHLAFGTTSPRISDGVLQESALDPDLTVGTRKFLTELDLAVLRDLGLKTFASPIPEPSSRALLALGGLALCGRRQRQAA